MTQEHTNGTAVHVNGASQSSGLRILVVDDSATIRRSAKVNQGHEIATYIGQTQNPFLWARYGCDACDGNDFVHFFDIAGQARLT